MTLALLEYNSKIATLTLNRPESRNALSLDLLASLHSRVNELMVHQEATVVVLTGAGKSFCAGMDLKNVSSDEGLAAGLPLKLLRSLAELTIKIRRLPQVVLAMVNGAAIGGGCGLACVADMAITHADSKMGFPEVDLGVCPAVVAPWLVRKVGPGRARAILLRGGLMSGQQALECGIVNQVVPVAGDLSAAMGELGARIASGGPLAMRKTKELLNQLDGSLDESLVLKGAELSAAVLCTPEAQAMLRTKLS